MSAPPDLHDAPFGRGPIAREFDQRLGRVALSEAAVLIEGESGSGKDTAARRLHALSPRCAGPLIEVDLAALSPTLMEAELFGHEQGAFTGADRARLGRFRRAEGGTLLLGGVERLPEGLQVKLLRVLQERCVEPLGAEQKIAVDARVVATSALDLAEMVHGRRFREDLYYRLAVVVLRVPPLRARPEDLPELAEVLVERIAARSGVRPRPLAPAALERLVRHPWPGNVRELENALERALVLGAGPGGGARPLEAADFDFLEQSLDGEAQRLARAALACGLTLAELEQALIEEALLATRDNVSAAARRLGLSRRALEYRRRRAPEIGDGGAEPGEEEEP